VDAGAAQTTNQVGINPDNKPAATLVSGLAALGAVLAAAGVTEGVVPKMAREQGLLFGLAVAGTLLAGLCGVIAALFATKRRRERGLLIASNVLLLAGLLFGLIGAIRVWNSTRVPTVTAAPRITAAGTFLNVTVKDSGLDSGEHVTLLVEPLHVAADPDSAGGTILTPGRAIYSASLGSDDDGKVDQAIKIRLPNGFQGYVGARAFTGGIPRGCYARRKSDGCISAKLVHVPERPQLKTHWSTHATRLRVLLGAQQIYGQTVSLRVFARRARDWHEIAYWHLAPDSAGSFSSSYTISGIRRWKAVCIVASTSERRQCPPRPRDPRSVWVRYRVPSDVPVGGLW
jgi:hypothetical protein